MRKIPTSIEEMMLLIRTVHLSRVGWRRRSCNANRSVAPSIMYRLFSKSCLLQYCSTFSQSPPAGSLLLWMVNDRVGSAFRGRGPVKEPNGVHWGKSRLTRFAWSQIVGTDPHTHTTNGPADQLVRRVSKGEPSRTLIWADDRVQKVLNHFDLTSSPIRPKLL